MTDYPIAAIPTAYRGRIYRSRLEARWAAFFDLLGWEHEYEPYDLGQWSPDFLLPGDEDDGIEEGKPPRVLVEIKPTTAFDAAVENRMTAAYSQPEK